MENRKKSCLSPYPFDGDYRCGYMNPRSTREWIGQTVIVEVVDTGEQFLGDILDHDCTGFLKLLVDDMVYEFVNGEAKIVSR